MTAEIYQSGESFSISLNSNELKYHTFTKSITKNNKKYDLTITNNNPSNYPNMKDGVTFKIGRVKQGYFIRITYITSTDIEKISEELETDPNGKTKEYILSNSATWNKDGTQESISPSSNKTATASAKYELLANLGIKKNITKANNTNYANDTKSQEVIATIGYTSSKYLDITDFVDGVGNLIYNFASKKYENDGVSEDYNKLKEIRKYIEIKNLTISIKSHYYGKYAYKEIYSNGDFTSEYSGSTLTYVNDTNELYKLHLVRNDGKDIPAQTDIRITYDLVFHPDEEDNYRLKDIYKGEKYFD